MNPEIKQRWVAALRSGEYTQGRQLLFSNGRYCCLGVLCDLYTKETGRVWFPTVSQVLPLEVVRWSGVSDSNPSVDVGLGKISLGNLNDINRYDFPTIADLIDKHL